MKTVNLDTGEIVDLLARPVFYPATWEFRNLFNGLARTYPDGSVQVRFSLSRYFESGGRRPDPVYHGDPPSDDDKETNLRISCFKSKQAIFDIARANNWDWFCTLTYSPEQLDRYSYDSVVNRMQSFTKYLRRHGCQWLLVPERHKDGAFHMHGLIAGDLPVDYALTNKKGEDVYNLHGFGLGWTTATRVKSKSRVSSYITKYTTKQLLKSIPPGRKRYWASRGLLRPKIERLDVTANNVESILKGMRFVQVKVDVFGNQIICAEGENVKGLLSDNCESIVEIAYDEVEEL